jgi:AraC family transcriptional regulator, regulatory protein of adaptative response / methylated-DNA-[protein]-cysteine methyltransferase
MESQEKIDFSRIALAVEYIKSRHKEQPDLDEVAEKVHLSPFHFQRLFDRWVGISPKKFLQYISIEYARKLLKEDQMTLSEAAFQTGLSGSGRLHDLFVKIEGMTPAEYRNQGENLKINYEYYESPFGSLLIASTSRGICYMAFDDENSSAQSGLKSLFGKASLIHHPDSLQQNALCAFEYGKNDFLPVRLHLKATEFQLKVWEALLKIPAGKVSTYGKIAGSINNPAASRAVGSAIGDNPVAYLIPCHRVILSNGEFGQYHWGSERKAAMLGWEISRHRLSE